MVFRFGTQTVCLLLSLHLTVAHHHRSLAGGIQGGVKLKPELNQLQMY